MFVSQDVSAKVLRHCSNSKSMGLERGPGLTRARAAATVKLMGPGKGLLIYLALVQVTSKYGRLGAAAPWCGAKGPYLKGPAFQPYHLVEDYERNQYGA